MVPSWEKVAPLHELDSICDRIFKSRIYFIDKKHLTIKI